MIRLRLATEDDIPELVEMGSAMVADSSFAPMTYAPGKVAARMRYGITDGLLAVAFDTEDGRIAGAMQGEVVAPFYSEDHMAVEQFLYVRPEYRGGRAALMLVKAWVHWAKASGAVQLRPATAATSEAAERLYLALGFQRVGSLFVMNRGELQ